MCEEPIYLYKGDHARAEQFFTQAERIDYRSTEVRAAALDGFADLELARDNLGQCEQLLDRIDTQLPAVRGFKPSWYQISPLAIRVRLLRRQGQWSRSLEGANLGVGLAHERGDRLMECTFQVLKAEVLTDLGEFDRAVAIMSEIPALVASTANRGRGSRPR